MKLYESVSILRPVQEESVNDLVVEKMRGILSQAGANILKLDNSGKKKLAYDIQHERKGTFITVQFEGPPTVVAELERFQRMEDQVMKFMTVRVNPADLVVAAEPEEPENTEEVEKPEELENTEEAEKPEEIEKAEGEETVDGGVQ